MKTTIAFHIGSIQEHHKNLQTYLFKDGYAVEEKGVSFNDIEAVKKSQFNRFTSDSTLLRIDIVNPGSSTITILKP